MKESEMNTNVELLSRAINFAVVQLPGRAFPGVVVQGDTMHSFARQVDEMACLLNAGNFAELASEINDLKQQLSAALIHYEMVCDKRGIALPYPPSK